MSKETILQRLKAEKTSAMRAKDTLKKGIIDTALGEIDRDPRCRTKIVNGEKQEPKNEAVLDVIKKLVKNLSTYETEQGKKEIEILKEFMPEQMSDEELDTIISDLIVSTGASSPREMGKVMGAFTKQYNGKADNGVVSQIIKQKLSALSEQ